MRWSFVIYLLVLSPSCLAAELDVWIGTVTKPDGLSRGIYHLSLDDETGKLSASRLVAEVRAPGFLTLHPKLPVLYSTGSIDGQASVVAYQIDLSSAQATLTLLGSQPIGDGGAAHVAVDQTGGVLFSAQYGGGSVAVFPLANDGQIEPRSQLVEHQHASGVAEGRQEAPHPHWVGVSKGNRFMMVPDLGADQVVVYRFDASSATLTPHAETATPPGGGPRHMAWSPDGESAYLINELALTLSRLAFDSNDGVLAVEQTIPTLSESQKTAEAFNSGSEVRVHPSGRFVYSANRGHDTITVFSVDPSSGSLSLVEQEPIRGSWPRNFNLDPSGRWLLAAGRDSNSLAVFEIDQATGELRYTLESEFVPAPICVVVGHPAKASADD